MARAGLVWGTAGAADLVEAIMRHILQHDGLHGEHVGKLHLRDVEGTHHVGPAWGGVGPASATIVSPRPWPLNPTLQTFPSPKAFPSDWCWPGKGDPASMPPPSLHHHTLLRGHC